jgi:hypothetical protein
MLRLMYLLSVICLPSSPQLKPQVPTEHPELVAGPWEIANTSGIDGIIFEMETASSGPTGRESFDWQTINIRVYHREGGKEAWGYFSVNDKASPESYSMQDDHSFSLFDGERLRIHSIDAGELKPFDLDITFSPVSNKWSGTWSRSGQNLHVVLTRPELDRSARLSPFVGDWIGEPDTHSAPGGLHVRESLDGALSVWLDRTTSGMDARTNSIHTNQRSDWLKVSSASDAGLVLETNNPTAPPAQFRGTLSEDHQILSVIWDQPGGGRLSAPSRFRKLTK